MISIIITTSKEPKTIIQTIEALITQELPKNTELLVISPELETQKIISPLMKKDKRIKFLQDEGRGKPAALNLAFKHVKKSSLLILTDGDVSCGKNAVKELLKPFTDPSLGLVSGHPLSLNPRTTLLGFWSHILTTVAHKIRMNSSFFVGSGYLMAIRNNLLHSIPEEALSDDAVISHLIFDKGFKISYAPHAYVFVKYPTTFKDWIKQKKRSTGGYIQLKNFVKGKQRMRSFTKESFGFNKVLWQFKSYKEAYWTFLLLLARLYLWFLIYFDIRFKRKTFKQLWVRVDSTK